MSVETYPQTSSELLKRIDNEWQALQSLLEPLSDGEIEKPGPNGDWAIKDHLDHVALWLDGLNALLSHENRWERMGLTAEDWRKPIDERNALLHERGKALSGAEAKARLAASHGAIVAAIGGLNDADLRRPFRDFAPNEANDSADEPLIGWIATDTYEHYAEHRQWIQEKLPHTTARG